METSAPLGARAGGQLSYLHGWDESEPSTKGQNLLEVSRSPLLTPSHASGSIWNLLRGHIHAFQGLGLGLAMTPGLVGTILTFPSGESTWPPWAQEEAHLRQHGPLTTWPLWVSAAPDTVYSPTSHCRDVALSLAVGDWRNRENLAAWAAGLEGVQQVGEALNRKGRTRGPGVRLFLAI